MSITRRIFRSQQRARRHRDGCRAELPHTRRVRCGRERWAHQASRRHLSARRRRWTEHRCPSRRAAVLRDAAQHQHSAQVGDRSRRILRPASVARRRFSRSGSRGISRSCTPPDRPTRRARTSTRRISWKPARPASKLTEDGWLNRSLHNLPSTPQNSPFRAIALGPSLPRILSGHEPAVAMNNINDFSVGGRNPKAFARRHCLRSHVRPLVRHRAARHRRGNVRRGEDAEGRRSRQVHARARTRTIPRDASATACASSRN